MSPADLLHPEALAWGPWLLALGALHLGLGLQQWLWQRRQFKAAALGRFGPGLSLPRLLAKLALWAAGGFFLLKALAVPLGPPETVEGRQSGADVVLCVDVSSSMLAQDAAPDRLGAVKRSLQGLLEGLGGDRVGLVAFAGGAVVACPLTSDLETLSLFLDKLDVESVPRDGTGLGPALALSLDGFAREEGRGRLVVLATDGEDNAGGDALAQARRLRQEGVGLACLGVGGPAGALIPGRRDIFGRVYAKTWKGQPVRTRLDREGLKRLAAEAGGELIFADSPSAPARLAEKVRRLKQGLASAPQRTVREPLYQGPLLWALALLFAESLLSARAGGLRRAAAAGRGAWLKLWRRPALGLLLLALAAPASAEGLRGRSDYNAANRAYRAGDYAGAAEAYRRAQAADPSRQAAAYNLGNALYQQADYRGAVQAYEQALALDPQDADARHNLELARRKLEQQGQGQEQKPQDKDAGQPKPGQGQGGQSQGQGGQGQGQGGQSQGQGGQSQGQGGQSQGQGGRASSLSRDQVEAMMNQLRLDERRYQGAFNPLKRRRPKEAQGRDPMADMLQQMTGRRPAGEDAETESDTKDW